jgi:hypothetical protein
VDRDEELARFKWLLMTGVIFLVSALLSYTELKYLLWGKSAQGKVTKSFESRVGDVGLLRSPQLAVEYTFTDAGTQRNEADSVPLDWPLPADGTVVIEYLAGSPNASRLQGHRHLWPVVFFSVALIAVGFFSFRLYREAREAVYGKRRPQRQR